MAAYGQSFPGIASATGTRLDSSSKHIMACKVNDSLLAQWCEDERNARQQLHTQKMRYCVHKDELVLNCGMPLTEKGTMLCANYAYPSVVSTLGDMTKTARRVLVGLYAESKTGRDFIQIKSVIADATANPNKFKSVFNLKSDEPVTKAMTEVRNLPHFQVLWCL